MADPISLRSTVQLLTPVPNRSSEKWNSIGAFRSFEASPEYAGALSQETVGARWSSGMSGNRFGMASWHVWAQGDAP